MDPLQEYRNKHNLAYLEREKEREHQKRLVEEKQRLLQLHIGTLLNDVELGIVEIYKCENIYEIESTLNDINKLISKNKELLNHTDAIKRIREKALDLLNSINQNPNIKTNLSNVKHISSVNSIKNTMKSILSIVGVIDENEDIDMEFEMDTSNDVEIAQRLQQEFDEFYIPIQNEDMD